MFIKVTKAKYLKDYKLELLFNDGLTGIINLQEHIYGPVFEPLKNKNYFKKFQLNRWTIEWENGADFAPEFLHELATQQNKAAAP
ncbi:MAG: DUF2442 domain-containing protein [Bacteroidia bacterium]|nr:DUF2442 domain-containing protein [Bacteroidia bacterium]